jgi:hypothetical protein
VIHDAGASMTGFKALTLIVIGLKISGIASGCHPN